MNDPLRDDIADIVAHSVHPLRAADRILATLVEHRDDVLATLGMKQVGWASSNCDHLGRQPCEADACKETAVPVFAAVPEGDTR